MNSFEPSPVGLTRRLAARKVVRLIRVGEHRLQARTQYCQYIQLWLTNALLRGGWQPAFPSSPIAPWAPRPGLVLSERLRYPVTRMSFPSTSAWTPVEFPLFDQLTDSTAPCQLSRSNWPRWAAESTQFTRAAYDPYPATYLRSTESSTGLIGALVTERIDPKDSPQIFNYNVYLLARSADERPYQSPPIATNDPPHHSSLPSTWFDGLRYHVAKSS